ncbi:uncharacterized protein JCM15063_000111 [Sporobolomyces koalae]|uniref:uncharacterized protein n=1 Tax=Sporobolomyces koalae TaxID=500713 RepID=UPI0031757AFD
MSSKKEPASIYTSLPTLPRIASAYDPLHSTASDRAAVAQLSTLTQHGSAQYLLEQHLEHEHLVEHNKRNYRIKYDRKLSKKRRRLEPAASVDLDHEPHPRAQEPAKKTTKRTVIDRTPLPQGYPSGSLLSSLHLYAAEHYAAHHALVPALTTTTPLLPPQLLSHFNSVTQSLNAHEERLLKQPNLPPDDVKLVKQTRTRIGARKHAWTNVERAFEPSALVAIGMLTDLLVQDAAQQPVPPVSLEHFLPPGFDLPIPPAAET